MLHGPLDWSERRQSNRGAQVKCHFGTITVNPRLDRIKLLYLCSFGCLLRSHKTCKVETRNTFSAARLAWRRDLKGPSNLLSCTKHQPDLYLESFVRSNTTIGCNVSHRRRENQILVEES